MLVLFRRVAGRGAHAYEEQPALEAADDDGAAGELDGDGGGFDGAGPSLTGLVVVFIRVVIVAGRGASDRVRGAGAGEG